MQINTNSWHFKAYRFMQTETMEKWKPSVCGYWATVFLGIPTFWIIVIAFSWMIPILWIVEKLETRFKGKSICPFGQVQFEAGARRSKEGE